MNIFSLLSGTLSSGAGGNTLFKGKIASLQESGALTEEALQDPRQLFETLLSEGLVKEGDLSKTALSGITVEQLSRSLGEKFRGAVEEIEEDAEEKSSLLSEESQDMSFEMIQVEGARCVVFTEPQSLQVVSPSREGEESLSGTAEKTEAELIALLTVLDRKNTFSFGESLSPKGTELSKTDGLGQIKEGEDFVLPKLFSKNLEEVSKDPSEPFSEKLTGLQKTVCLEEPSLSSEAETGNAQKNPPLERQILPSVEIDTSERESMPWGEAEGENPEVGKSPSINGMDKTGVKVEEETFFGEPQKMEGKSSLLLPGEMIEGSVELLSSKTAEEPQKEAPPVVMQQAATEQVSGEILKDSGVVGPKLLSEKTETLRSGMERQSPLLEAVSQKTEETVLSEKSGGESSGGGEFESSEEFLFSSELPEEEFLVPGSPEKRNSFEGQLEASQRIGSGVSGSLEGSSRTSETVSGGLSSVPLPQSGLSSLGEGVAATLRIVRTSEGNRAQIVVDPPALGRVEVSLQSTDQGMSAVLRVDNEGLRQLLQGQMESLRSSLQQQGITVTNLSVDVRQGGDQASSGREDQNSGSRRRQVNSLLGTYDLEGEEELSTYHLDMERGLLSWMA